MTFGGRLEAFFTVPSAVTIAAKNGSGGPTSVSLTAGSYTPTTYLAHVVTRLNAVMGASDWSGSLSTGTSGTGFVTLTNPDVGWTITWTTPEAGTALGFAGNIGATTGAAVGTRNARGLFLPDCPLYTVAHPASAPEFSDMRSTESPTGEVISLVGSYRYEHSGLRYSHVPVAKCVEYAATTTYASWEQWIKDTQTGRGHTWFSIGSAFQVYWDSAGTDTLLGIAMNSGAGPTYGWKASPPLKDFSPKRVDQAWNGMWSIEIPRLVSAG